MTSTSSDSPKLGPVQSQERIILLDVLRATAILGMFYVNWIGIYHPDLRGLPLGGIQDAASFVIGFFAVNKSRALFALLMGVGMGIQIERADERGKDIIPIYLRRLFFLFLLSWFGSMFLRVSHLQHLAVAGFVALFIGYGFRRHSRFLLVFIVWLFLANSFPSIQIAYQREISDTPFAERFYGPSDQAQERTPQQEQRYQSAVERYEERIEAATNIQSPIFPMERVGRYIDSRLKNPIPREFRSLENLVTSAPELICFLLFGFFLWQIGLFKRTWERRRFFLYLLFFSASIGVAEWIDLYLISTRTPLLNAVSMFLYLFPIGLDLAYISILALLLTTDLPKRVVTALAPAGRMAFTNYVLHWALPPILFPLLFGFWLPGVGRAETMLKVTVVFALMVLFSTWWLKRFRFGPFEWLWRSLTYWKFQPMRVERPVQVE